MNDGGRAGEHGSRVYRVAHNTAISRVIRPLAAAPTIVALDEDLESAIEAVDREQTIDRRRALDRLYALIWRRQPADSAMPLDEIRTKATAFELRVRRWRLVGGVTMGLLVAKNVWEVWTDSEAIERAGDLFMLAALVFVLLRFLRHARAETAPSTLGTTSCIEHYRSRLMRERDLSRDGWKFVMPFVPGFALILAGRAIEGRPASQVAILIALAIAMLGGALWVIARGGRQIEREIAELD